MAPFFTSAKDKDEHENGESGRNRERFSQSVKLIIKTMFYF